MDRHLKERLVGAAVLVAAATILIPEMLSVTHDSSDVIQESTSSSDSSGIKTYTIDLSAPSGETPRPDQASPQTFIEPAPPPEPVPANNAAAEPQSASVPTQSVIVNRDEQLLDQYRTPHAAPNSVTEPKPAAAQAVENKSEKSETKTVEKNTEKAIANQVAVATEKNSTKSQGKPAEQSRGGWAVQVASFEARATSDRVAAELKGRGFSAFVVPFSAKGKTMYRVRVGPVEDRAAAEVLLKKIRPLHPQAALAPP